MFVAMNRFKVKKGSEDEFEQVWTSRDIYLDKMPGFVEFHLLKGPVTDDYTLFSSQPTWQCAKAWTRSEGFRMAHARAGNTATSPLYLESQKFEGFEVRQTVTRQRDIA